MQAERVELDIGGKTLFIETGVLAKQAAGSVVVGLEETMILAAVSMEDKPRTEQTDFLPLTVDYRDRMSAAGRIPGGFFKREARPSDRETLASRLTDRSVRPMFSEGYFCETQIIIHPLSFDYENEADVQCITAASACLSISPAPFHNPVSGVRVGRADGQFILFPTIKQLADTDINLIVSGTAESIVMVEGGGKEIMEDDLVAALEFAHVWIKKICAMQKELVKKAGKPKISVSVPDRSKELALVTAKVDPAKFREALLSGAKAERAKGLKDMRNTVVAEILAGLPEGSEINESGLKAGFEAFQGGFMRRMALEENLRVDGRGPKDIRKITIAVDALPRTHGSSLFTRGETQALVTTTLGTGKDELMQERLEGRVASRFMLHYNFPPFCVGEVKRVTGPGRREIGHGVLAERAIEPVLPSAEEFPYTIRVVSEILESNGSSSMASVCGTSLCLMDAGVPIKAAVAGIAMGLVKEGGKTAILTDILGIEDALGDMDFKVAGTRKGITAVQMDIKIEEGLPVDILRRALDQAKEGRLFILDKMEETISTPRAELNKNAPRMHTIRINTDKVGALIGPGGKVIRGIVAETGCQIDIKDDGSVVIATNNQESLDHALRLINAITQDAEAGRIYVGTVKKIVDFGAFIEIFPGTEGLCHISELANHRVGSVSDILSNGDEVLVKVLEIDGSGKIRLSRREAMSEKGVVEEEKPSRGGSERSGGDRGSERGGGGRPSPGGRGDRNNRR
jgi:polyribonucleotide nucleotidyltransferase